MVHLTKIYTKTGDGGQTYLNHGTRVVKSDPRIRAVGSVDEANSSLGMVFSLCRVDPHTLKTLKKIQNDLFDLGADLVVPITEELKLRITQEQIDYLEKEIDKYNAELKPLRSFVLPSGRPSSSLLHNARAVVRRAECDVWCAIEAHEDTMSTLTAKYLNRLSDLLFVMARYLNNDLENLWIPGGEGA